MTERPAGRAESGVRELIERLQEDGIEAGRREAERLVTQAQEHAAILVADAERRAARLLEDARAEAARETAAADSAFATAQRDAQIALKEAIVERLAARIELLLANELAAPALLRDLILAIGGRALPERSRELPVVFDVGDPALLDALTASGMDGLLREGITLAASGGPGLRLVLARERVEVDLGAPALAALLHSRLLPRVRARLDGELP